jgi:predicted kinase
MSNPTKKATLYIIHGFIGAGKTTFSKKLESEIGAIRLNPDEWCVKIFEKKDYETNWEKCFADTMNILWNKTVENLKNGKSVILDMGFWDKESRDFARMIAKQNGADFKHYYIFTPDNVAKARISSRKGKIAENNIKNFDEIKKLFCPPDDDEIHTVINNC